MHVVYRHPLLSSLHTYYPPLLLTGHFPTLIPFVMFCNHCIYTESSVWPWVWNYPLEPCGIITGYTTKDNCLSSLRIHLQSMFLQGGVRPYEFSSCAICLAINRPSLVPAVAAAVRAWLHQQRHAQKIPSHKPPYAPARTFFPPSLLWCFLILKEGTTDILFRNGYLNITSQ